MHRYRTLADGSQQKVTLTAQRTPDGHLKAWRKVIGQYKAADGTVKPKVFTLGQDEAVALVRACAMLAAWDSVPVLYDAEGREAKLWTDEYVRRGEAYYRQRRVLGQALDRHAEQATTKVNQWRLGLTGADLDPEVVGEYGGELARPVPAADQTPAAAEPAAPSTATKGTTLYEAFALYVQTVTKGPDAESTKLRKKQIIENDIKRRVPDRPLAECDYLWLQSMTNIFRAKTPPLKLNSETARLSPWTVKTIMQRGREFFDWLEDSDIGWKAPNRWERLFKFKVSNDEAEGDEDGGIAQLTVDEIKTLYHAGTDWHRLLLLHGVCTGQTQTDLASSKGTEYDLTDCTYTHRRTKTRVKGIHWMPPELVGLVQTFRATRPDGLAWQTRDGNMLVTWRDGKRVSDAVKLAWDDLWERAYGKGTRPRVGYKFCRKYLSQFCKSYGMRIYGSEELGAVALQHRSASKACETLNKHYADRREFTPLHMAERAMYDEFKSAGVFDVPAADRKKPEKKQAKKVRRKADPFATEMVV